MTMLLYIADSCACSKTGYFATGLQFTNYGQILFKIRRAPLKPFAFFAFGYIFDLTTLKEGFHFYFTPAGTKEFLRCNRCTAVFAGLGHIRLLTGNPAVIYKIKLSKNKEYVKGGR